MEGHQLEAVGVQVEIDGGFEGKNSVTLVEAKIGECEDFHLRQLYYPVRFWSTHTKKQIRAVFFTYQPGSEVYRFREYDFQPLEVYGPPRLVRAAAYRIVDAPQDTFQPIITHRECPFPQADRLDKVAIIPFLVEEGQSTPEQLAEIFEFSARQGRYYLDACRALGLLNATGLTKDGENYLKCSPEVRYRVLCRAVLKLPVIQEIMTNLLLAPNKKLSRAQVEIVVEQATSLAPATARRRSQTVWAWLAWVSVYCPALRVKSAEIELSTKKSPRIDTIEQLDLF